MDAKKTIKNLFTLLICLSALALMGLNLYQHQQIKKATHGISTESASPNESAPKIRPDSGRAAPINSARNPVVASQGVQSENNEVDELAYQLDAAREELAMVNKQLSEEEAKKAEQKKLQKELQKKYREDPSYKKSMRDSLDIQYADLFKKLNLSSENLDKFKDLLVQESLAQQEIYYEYYTDEDTHLSMEQQKEINSRYQALDREYDSKKADLLGENGYEKYRKYSETEYERYNINNFITTLNTNEKLTDTQKEALIGAMHNEIANVTWERANEDSESSANMYDEKNIARMLSNYDRRIDAYLKAGDGLLSAPQLDQFKAYLQKDRDQYKIIMEMSALRYSTNTQKSDERDSK